jgi:hypothetical protein
VSDGHVNQASGTTTALRGLAADFASIQQVEPFAFELP